MDKRYFRLWDCKEKPGPGGVIEIFERELQEWNDKKFGIFWCVNEFKDIARKKENLTKIVTYYADIDARNKNHQFETLKKGLKPSLIIETKRGFQAYWNVSDGSIANWKIIIDRLGDYYNSDPNARDVLRILRVPGYFHYKNPTEPFLIKKVYLSDIKYTEKDLKYFYPESDKEKMLKTPIAQEIIKVGGNNLWDKIFNMNCEKALYKLSGSEYVGGEKYTFRRVGNGNMNIYVDGKSTSCWVDEKGHIGSHDKGGPLISCWLKWYGNSNKDVYQIMREVFPEVFDEN